MPVIGQRLRASRLRGACLAAGAVAVCAMVVVGCQSVTDGSATLDGMDVPLYRASTSSSSEASVSKSVARESQRRAAAVTKAVHESCEALSSGSVDAIAAVNGYVDAFNTNAADMVARAALAAEALNRTADAVGGTISEPLSVELRDALDRWVEAARSLSTAVENDAPMADFNVAIRGFNESQTHALELCDAAY